MALWWGQWPGSAIGRRLSSLYFQKRAVLGEGCPGVLDSKEFRTLVISGAVSPSIRFLRDERLESSAVGTSVVERSHPLRLCPDVALHRGLELRFARISS